MAIVKMKRLVVVGPEQERTRCVERLQGLGVLHVVPFEGDITESADLVSALNHLQRVLGRLELRAKTLEDLPEQPEGGAEEFEARAATASARLVELESMLAALEKERSEALPWGGQSARDIAELARHGVHVQLYQPRPRELGALDLSRAVWTEFFPWPGRSGSRVLALISSESPLSLDAEELSPPEKTAAEIERELSALAEESRAVREELDRLCGAIPALNRRKAGLEDKLALHRALDSTREEAGVFALAGWCPAEQADRVKAELDGWAAVLLDDPRPEDEVPVALRNGRIAAFFEPLVKMFELPNYRGIDSTVLMAPFMTVFFALSMGDAAYGLILLVAAVAIKKKVAPEGMGLLATNMLILFGAATLVLGLLTGTLMGAPIYGFSFVQNLGLDDKSLLFSLSSEPQNFFYLSLGLGVLQMTFGMSIKVARRLRQGLFQESLSTVGLMSIVPGIGVWLLVDPVLGKAIFIASLALVFVFNSPYGGIAKRIGGGAWGIYDRVIGLGGDIMSYVRIFGLGLASGIIGLVVNQMAGVVAEGGSVVGYFFAALVFVFGHTFNLLMAIIGAIVHPARLQFLEFYGTFFEGGGSPYQPLRAHTETNSKEERS